MKYSVYIIKSLKDHSFYIGVSKNPEKRVKQHNQGITRSTKGKIPWQLVYKEDFDNTKDAYRRERYIKSRKKRQYIEKTINTPL